MKVSVLVPIYNTAHYLRQCLDSLLGQTLEDIEIICINDGSTDGCADILEEYANFDKRIQVIHKKNTGYGHSMNVGLEQAKGEYVGIVESDDFADASMFKCLYEAAITKNADIVKSDYLEFFYEKNVPVTRRVFGGRCVQYNSNFKAASCKAVFRERYIWSAIYKREFLIDNQIRFHETPGASYQDVSFSFQVNALAKRICWLNEAYLHYRIDNQESSVNSPEKIFCIFDEHEEIQRFLDKKPNIKIELQAYEEALKFWDCLYHYSRVGVAFQYALLLRIQKELYAAHKSDSLVREVWEDELWEKHREILNSPEQFFRKTGKDYCDPRIKQAHVMNPALYRDVFLQQINQYQKLYLFGAGKVAEEVYRQISYWSPKQKIEAFLVTDKRMNPEKLEGIPVVCAVDVQEELKDVLVVISVREKDQYIIDRYLWNLGARNMIAADRGLRTGLQMR